MNEEKAKFILSSGIPRELDADQEGIQEALDTAASNPKIAEWMVKQQEATDAIHAKLNEVPVPPGLKDRILAGEAVSRSRRGWSRRSIPAMAAALAVLLGISVLQFLPRSAAGERSFAGLRADMSEFLSGYFRLEMQSKHLERLQAHLADKHEFTNYTVPGALARNTSVGCRTIEWHDGEVALICFSVEGELVHLMILPKEHLPVPPTGLGPVQEGEWATTSWQDDENVYLVATRGAPEFLQDVMGGQVFR